ncbi:expressed unknown protein [Seminavis robusta]|uniref:Uncharacterized protein n=1 Tax=Seminavis robusta TaxID=568900 RepID=A0A9N8DX98_9STRA|nr:expressed unknown protein [Seminavis robusta]|eukprot:Sro315_g115360.1 n/a (455) ;mRNA; f:55268-56632
MASNTVGNSTNTATIAFAVGAVVASTIWLATSKQKKKPLHVSYNKPKLHWAFHILAALPTSMRRKMLLQGAAPKPPMDVVSLGSSMDDDTTTNSIGSSPYMEKKELVPGKLWRVRYQFARDLNMMGIYKSMFGWDLLDTETLLKQVPNNDEKIKEQLKQIIQDLAALQDSIGKDDDAVTQAKKVLQAGLYETQDMLVVKLDNTDGGLLLYNPCRMHEEMIQYLHTLGSSVDYIVSGSSSHTNQLPQAMAAFPSAKLICAGVAHEKCLAAGMATTTSAIIYTDGFQAAAAELAPLGVQPVHIVGDTFTQSLVLVAHGHLLDVDLSTYGNGYRYLHISDDDWNNTDDRRLSMGYFRLLYYASVANGTVAKGYLPDFRVLGCDPTSIFHKLMPEEPEPDGSSCVAMAQSLRNLLTNVKFDFVDNVHSSLEDACPADEFKQAVNGCWSWLDGKSLLEA